MVAVGLTLILRASDIVINFAQSSLLMLGVRRVLPVAVDGVIPDRPTLPGFDRGHRGYGLRASIAIVIGRTTAIRP